MDPNICRRILCLQLYTGEVDELSTQLCGKFYAWALHGLCPEPTSFHYW
jgi:hypothetical protein